MRIAIWHNLPSGGGKRALYYQVQGLLNGGHHVESWCPPTADQSYLPLRALIHEHVIPLDIKSSPTLNRISHSLGNWRDLREKLTAIDVHCRRCAIEINAGNFDVLMAAPCRFFRTTPIARYTSSPSLMYLQEPYRWLYEALPHLPWPARPEPIGLSQWFRHIAGTVPDFVRLQANRIQARDELTNIRAFDLVLVNSYYSRESVLRAYGIDARVCYLGIDTELFSPCPVQRHDFVVGIGAVFPEKNISFIIEAVSRTRGPKPALSWIANAASWDHMEYLKKLSASLKVEFVPRVNVDDEEIVEILSRAAVMAYAPRLEPFGFAPLEAGACELPVVAVAEGGVRETVFDGVNGFLVEQNADAMACAIDAVRGDRTLANTLGREGRKLALDRWSLLAAASRLEAYLLNVAQSGPRATPEIQWPRAHR